jgi:hypothetical protein
MTVTRGGDRHTPPMEWLSHLRRSTCIRADPNQWPVLVSSRVILPKRAIKWQGRYRRLTVLRFARMHVRPLNRNNHLAEYRPEWRLIEWSKSKDESIKYMDEIARRVPRRLCPQQLPGDPAAPAT